ncbi:MAG: hypothetical protein AAB427_05995 [Chloroflexota bacterium]
MKRVQSKEWLWVAVFSVLVMALTCVPSIVGAAHSGGDWRFSGFVFGVEDGNSYLAKMQLGAHGQWLFQLPYAIEDHPKSLTYLLYILLGKLAGWIVGTADPLRLHTALVVTFHAARVIFGLGLLFASYRFLAEMLPFVRQRRFGLIVVALGGGLGWLSLVLGLPGTPLEFYSPEAFTFLDLYGLPHLAAARIMFLLGLLWYLQAVKGRWPWMFAAGVAWFVMTLIQPLYMLIVYVLLGMHVAVLTVLSLQQREGELTRGVDLGATAVRALWMSAVAGAGGLPLVLYTFLLFTVDPVYQTWGGQNIILSPAPWHYVSAWGLLVVAGLFGFRTLYRRNILVWALVVGWLVSLPVLLYIPNNLQRRFAEAAQLPLTALAVLGLTLGIFKIGRWKFGPPVRRYAVTALTALTLPATVLLWAGGLAAASSPSEPVYQPRDQVAAYAFLARSLPPRALVLSSYEFGNAVPAYGYLVAYVGHGPETPYLEYKLDTVNDFYSNATPNSDRFYSYSYLNSPYVVIGPHEHSLGRFDPSNPRQADYLVRIFQAGDYSVWSLKTSK